MAKRKSADGISKATQKVIVSHTRALGRATAGAIALAMFLPVGGLSAQAATEEKPGLTIEDLAAMSADQIRDANSDSPGKEFSSSDLIALASDKIAADRIERDRLLEEARLAAEARALEEARAKAEAEAAAKLESERLAAEQAAEAARIEAQRIETDRATVQKPQAVAPQPQSPPLNVAPASTAEGLVAAAKAQLGVKQDCTDLVQNSLSSMGFTTRRDQGGFDLGTGIWQYDHFGPRVPLDAILPGDILVYGNAGSGHHVSIYIGDGKAVHGGHNGSTVIASMHSAYQAVTGAIRPGA